MKRLAPSLISFLWLTNLVFIEAAQPKDNPCSQVIYADSASIEPRYIPHAPSFVPSCASVRSPSFAPSVAPSGGQSERKDYASHAYANSNHCQAVRSGSSEAADWYTFQKGKSYTSGIIHWKFKPVASSIIIGVTHYDTGYDGYFGGDDGDDDKIYYGFYNYGILYSNDKQVKFNRNVKHFGENDTITMQLNLDDKTISYWINSEFMGIAFNGIRIDKNKGLKLSIGLFHRDTKSKILRIWSSENELNCAKSIKKEYLKAIDIIDSLLSMTKYLAHKLSIEINNTNYNNNNNTNICDYDIFHSKKYFVNHNNIYNNNCNDYNNIYDRVNKLEEILTIVTSIQDETSGGGLDRKKINDTRMVLSEIEKGISKKLEMIGHDM